MRSDLQEYHMAENKTVPNNKSVKKFLDTLVDETKRKDCHVILKMMQEITGEKAKMWGDSIIGFGQYHYQYASGREGDFFVTGFAPRKQDLTIYIMPGFTNYTELLARLGKHKTGKSSLYIKNLADADRNILEKLISRSVDYMRRNHPCT